MRAIKVKHYKTNVYDFVIRIGNARIAGGAMAISVTTEELQEIVRQSRNALKKEES